MWIGRKKLIPVTNRNIRLRNECNISSGVGLEIGPLASPVVRKDEGRIYYVDYLSTEQLRQKCAADPNVNINNIVQVDFILGRITYKEIPSILGRTFDYIIASHVFEHTPNPIGWLKCLADILHPEGIISLAIPDRRYTFDFYRKETTLSQLWSYELEQLTRPCISQIVDEWLNVKKVDTRNAWTKDYSKCNPEKYHSIGELIHMVKCAQNGEYVDCHCTVWTYESFCDIFDKIKNIIDIPLRIYSLYKPQKYSNEFFVQFKK